jgi:hypothetical protein
MLSVCLLPCSQKGERRGRVPWPGHDSRWKPRPLSKSHLSTGYSVYHLGLYVNPVVRGEYLPSLDHNGVHKNLTRSNTDSELRISLRSSEPRSPFARRFPRNLVQVGVRVLLLTSEPSARASFHLGLLNGDPGSLPPRTLNSAAARCQLRRSSLFRVGWGYTPPPRPFAYQEDPGRGGRVATQSPARSHHGQTGPSRALILPCPALADWSTVDTQLSLGRAPQAA